MASKKQLDSEQNTKTGKFSKKQKSEIITISESEKYDCNDEHQPLGNPELKKLPTQTQIEILSKALKEFMFKNRFLTDKVQELEKLIKSFLEKQYQSKQEIENKLEQRIFQIQQQTSGNAIYFLTESIKSYGNRKWSLKLKQIVNIDLKQPINLNQISVAGIIV